MAGTVTKYGNDKQHIGIKPEELVFDYLAEVGASKSEEAVLAAMPAGVTYLGAEIQTLIADVGATSTVLNLKHGTTSIFTGSADSGGTVNTIDDGAASGAFLPAAAETAGATAGNLIADFDQVGTTSTAPKFRIRVFIFRSAEPS